MGKYRKKPVVIEAWQWDESKETLSMLCSRGMKWSGHRGHRDKPDLCSDLRIATPEGIMNVSPGDWIICGVKGELYPCKPDIFAATYEESTNG